MGKGEPPTADPGREPLGWEFAWPMLGVALRGDDLTAAREWFRRALPGWRAAVWFGGDSIGEAFVYRNHDDRSYGAVIPNAPARALIAAACRALAEEAGDA